MLRDLIVQKDTEHKRLEKIIQQQKNKIEEPYINDMLEFNLAERERKRHQKSSSQFKRAKQNQTFELRNSDLYQSDALIQPRPEHVYLTSHKKARKFVKVLAPRVHQSRLMVQKQYQDFAVPILNHKYSNQFDQTLSLKHGRNASVELIAVRKFDDHTFSATSAFNDELRRTRLDISPPTLRLRKYTEASDEI